MNLKKVREGILLVGAVAAILWLILATSALVATAIWRGDENVKEIQETEIGALQAVVIRAGFELVNGQFKSVNGRLDSTNREIESIKREMRSGFEAAAEARAAGLEAAEAERAAGLEAAEEALVAGLEAAEEALAAGFEDAEAERAAIAKVVAVIASAFESSVQESRDQDQELERLILSERERVEQEIQFYREVIRQLEQRIETLEAALN